MNIMKLLLVILTTLSLTLGLQAQHAGHAGAGTGLGFSPRNMGMGNAMAATTSEGIYPYYNPAFAGLNPGFSQFDITVAALQYDRTYQTAGATFRIPPNAGFAIALVRSGVKNIDGRTLSGYPTGQFSTSEYQLTGAFGLNVSQKLKAGVAFKLSYADLSDQLQASSALGIDLGVLYSLNEHLNAAVVIQDLFAEYRWDSSSLYELSQARQVSNKFPVRYKAGLSWMKANYTLSADYEIQSLTSDFREIGTENGSTSEGIISRKNSVQQLRLGGSWDIHERFTLRSGLDLSNLRNTASSGGAVGFSIHLPFDKYAPSVDYAFVTEPNRISNMHVFSLNLKL